MRSCVALTRPKAGAGKETASPLACASREGGRARPQGHTARGCGPAGSGAVLDARRREDPSALPSAPPGAPRPPRLRSCHFRAPPGRGPGRRRGGCPGVGCVPRLLAGAAQGGGPHSAAQTFLRGGVRRKHPAPRLTESEGRLGRQRGQARACAGERPGVPGDPGGALTAGLVAACAQAEAAPGRSCPFPVPRSDRDLRALPAHVLAAEDEEGSRCASWAAARGQAKGAQRRCGGARTLRPRLHGIGLATARAEPLGVVPDRQSRWIPFGADSRRDRCSPHSGAPRAEELGGLGGPEGARGARSSGPCHAGRLALLGAASRTEGSRSAARFPSGCSGATLAPTARGGLRNGPGT